MGIIDGMSRFVSKIKILNELNDAQKKPVQDYQGASVIIAGAGSGKTKTLVSRTAYMIEDGIDPSSILLFTFTRKAANEIKERILKYVGDKASKVTIGTYHSFCLRLLKTYYPLLGFEKNFTVFDETDSLREIKKVCFDNIEPRILKGTISRYKENMLSPRMAANQAVEDFEVKAAQAYNDYQRSLKNQNALDFDDITYFVVRLMENYPEVTEKINNRYKYIVSDESQDGSLQNLRLIELLGGELFNVCLVGDDNQSIYSFRGANVNAMFEFTRRHNMKEFVLGQNYRSTQTIVDASQNMIKKNDVLFQKKIYSENEFGDKIKVCALANPMFEANQVVVQIKQALRAGMKPADIAVLYRMNFLSRKIEDALLKNSIPYRVLSGVPFYERKEIKDLICYLRFVYNDNDKAALERIINVPKRGLGETTLKKILESSSDKNLTDICKTVKLNAIQRKNLDHLMAVIELCREMINSDSPKKILKELITQISYFDYLKQDFTEDADERIGNVKELMEVAGHYETLQDFLENIIVSDEESNNIEENDDKVSLMTIHGSKGLEFPMVIIVGATEGVIPSSTAVAEGNLQEERRIMYVGMTRAKKTLLITYPKMTFRNGTPIYTKPSRFIDEISSKYIEKI